MAKRSSVAPIAALTVDPESKRPLYQQVYDGLREAILGGRLAVGTRLPSTRDLATDLGVSRNTVATAVSQLIREGCIESRVGSGMFVSPSLHDAARVPTDAGLHVRDLQPTSLSARGEQLAELGASFTHPPSRPRPFEPCVPAFDDFPFEIWRRLHSRYWRDIRRDFLSYADPAGHPALRREIAEHLAVARAVRCSWKQVIVVSGAQVALELACRLLLDPGDAAWFEDPGYHGARSALIAAGARIAPIPIDGEGLEVGTAERRAPDARLAYVTPSHQFPLGVTMSLPRRLALLQWAYRSGAWIVEDDYDSDFRYTNLPLPALQGLDHEGRVIYVGTFSKVLFPALRIGYLVVPEQLVDSFTRAHAMTARHVPPVDQAVLADFMARGHFARHLRRMSNIYKARRDAFAELLERHLADMVALESPPDGGLHCVAWLRGGLDDGVASARIAAEGISSPALSRYSMCGVSGGLLLGFGVVDPTTAEHCLKRMANALSDLGLHSGHHGVQPRQRPEDAPLREAIAPPASASMTKLVPSMESQQRPTSDDRASGTV